MICCQALILTIVAVWDAMCIAYGLHAGFSLQKLGMHMACHQLVHHHLTRIPQHFDQASCAHEAYQANMHFTQWLSGGACEKGPDISACLPVRLHSSSPSICRLGNAVLRLHARRGPCMPVLFSMARSASAGKAPSMLQAMNIFECQLLCQARHMP